MGELKKIPLPVTTFLSAHPSQLPPELGERLVDCYVETIGGVPNIRKRPAFGSAWIDFSQGSGIDGLYWWAAKSVLIVVCNGKIFKVTSSTGDYSDITGTHTPETGQRVSFDTDGSYLVMANGGKMLLYDNTGNPEYITDPDAPTQVTHVGYLDDYILANVYGTGRFQWCNNSAPPEWDATDYATAESKADELIALMVANREIGLFGKESIEFWYNDGVSPFSRMEPVFVEYGCFAKNSIRNYGGMWIWIDDKRRVMTMAGRTPTPISEPLDDVIRDMSAVSDATAYIIDIGKNAFYVLSFPTENRTFAFNLTSKTWTEWGKWDSEAGAYNKFLGANYVYCKDWGFHIIGDPTSGKIYKLSASTYQDAGADVRVLIRTGNVTHGSLALKRSNGLNIRLRRGLGNGGGTPSLTIRWRDEGQAWSDEAWHTLSLGGIGEYNMVLPIKRLGIYRARQYEIVYTGNTDFIIEDMEEDIDWLRA